MTDLKTELEGIVCFFSPEAYKPVSTRQVYNAERSCWAWTDAASVVTGQQKTVIARRSIGILAGPCSTRRIMCIVTLERRCCAVTRSPRGSHLRLGTGKIPKILNPILIQVRPSAHPRPFGRGAFVRRADLPLHGSIRTMGESSGKVCR